MQLVNWFNNKKTYIVSGCMIVYALSGAYLGHMSWSDAEVLCMQALGLASVRHAISKVQK